jgi:hypothetical protein
MGESARESVKQHFLLARLLQQDLDMLNSFESIYRLNMP